MSFTDRTLTCVDCGASFVFTAEDQTYHAEKGYTNDPKRCPTCRSQRRGQRDGGAGAGYGEREMYTATCSSCGKEARVPFQPRGDRPVYCSDCFRKTQGTQRPGGRDFGQRSSSRGGRW